MSQINYLERGIGIAQQTLDAMWRDIIEGKMTLEQMREKHEARYEMASDAIEKATELPEVEILIEQEEDGTIRAVNTKTVLMTFAVYRDGYLFDKYVAQDTKTFDDYEDKIDEIEAADVVNEVNN